MSEDKNVIKMKEKGTAKQPKQESINVDLGSMPVLYSDSVFAAGGDFGLTLYFAQRIGSSNNQKLVSSLGLSWEHAHALMHLLERNLKSHAKRMNDRKIDKKEGEEKED